MLDAQSPAPQRSVRRGWTESVGRTVRNPYLLLLAALTLLGLALRLPSVTDALFGDELSTYVVVEDHGIGRMFELIHSDQEVTPPFYFLLAWLCQQLGRSSDWLRLAPMLAGLGSIPLTYLVGRRTVGRAAGVVGACLVALSPYLIFYSTEARGYAVAMFCCLLSTYSLLRASSDAGQKGWWALYALTSAAAVYTHYSAMFLLLAQAIWALVARPESRNAVIAANAGAAILFLPWLPGYLEDNRSPGAELIGLLQPFTLDAVRLNVSRWALGNPFVEIRALPGDPALAMIAVGLVTGVVAAARRTLRSRPSSQTVLVLVLAIAAPLGTMLYSSVSVSVFTGRNLISSSPGLALLAGAIVTAGRGWVRVVSAGLVIGGFLIGSIAMLDSANQRSDYDAAARTILAAGQPQAPIVDVPFAAPGAKQSLEVALDDLGAGDRPVFRLGISTLSDAYAIRASGAPGQSGTEAPIPSGAEVAREVLRDAKGGPIFFVVIGGLSFDQLRESGTGYVGDFIATLPRSYGAVSTTYTPGFSNFGASVFELEKVN